MKEIDLKAMGKRIKELRRRLGLNQEQLGQKIKLSKTTICDDEKGKTAPSFEFLYHFSELTGISLDSLVRPGVDLTRPDYDSQADAGDNSPFGDYYREVTNLLDYMKKSSLVLVAVITMANEYISNNKALVENNIKMEKEKREKEKENEVES